MTEPELNASKAMAMFNRQHSTPSPELRAQWREEAPRYRDGGVGREDWLMDRAAHWASSQQEHCVKMSLHLDLSPESLKRLCDGLAAAVKPDGGYRALTTNDDDISDRGFVVEQQVGVEWWLPKHGTDSLENTLDAIKGGLIVAVQDWLPTALIPASHSEK